MSAHRGWIFGAMMMVAGSFVTSAVAATAPFSRDLSTDRPDATESPYTVEAGRFQVEIEAVRWARESEDGVRGEALVLGATNFKYGLNDRADLQVIIEPLVRLREKAGGTRTTTDGFGDTTVRLKLNLVGNDSGDFAAGVMPFVKLPTASDDLGNGEVEGGVIVPFAWSLPGGWGVGAMAEFDLVRNAADDGHELAVVTTATVAREIAPNLGMFVELANEASDGNASTWVTSFNTGLTYALSPDRQLDAGVNLGMSDAAEDVALFLGYTTRW